MAKQVTRTMPVYNYSFLKVETENGQPKITGTANLKTSERMGERKLSQYIKEHEELTGYVCGGVTEELVTYAMDMDYFLEHAQVVPTRQTKANTDK